MSVISRTAAVEHIKNSKGKFFGITFKKNDGTTRTLNGKVKSKDVLDNLGYVKFKSSKNEYKAINPRTIEKLTINKEIYIIK